MSLKFINKIRHKNQISYKICQLLSQLLYCHRKLLFFIMISYVFVIMDLYFFIVLFCKH